MEDWLKTKTAGLPRWAWATLFGGAIALGLYLRSRSQSDEEVKSETVNASEQSLASYEGTGTAGGLASAGLVGPAQGQVLPVEAPYIPEGFVDIFSELTSVIGELGGYITEHQNVVTENPPTGGGAPLEGGNHSLPGLPTATCPTSVVNSIRQNKAEIDRLQGEIKNLQQEVNTLTNWIQAHPNAKDVNKWKTQRAADQTNIQGKRAKIAALSAANTALRAKPGCSKVSV